MITHRINLSQHVEPLVQRMPIGKWERFILDDRPIDCIADVAVDSGIYPDYDTAHDRISTIVADLLASGESIQLTALIDEALWVLRDIVNGSTCACSLRDVNGDVPRKDRAEYRAIVSAGRRMASYLNTTFPEF